MAIDAVELYVGTEGADGSQASTPSVPVSAATPLPTQNYSSAVSLGTPTTGTLTAVSQVIGPVQNVGSVAVYTGSTAFVGSYVFETSVDGNNWVAQPLDLVTGTGGTQSSGSSINALWYGNVVGTYFRVRCSAFTSGSAAVTIIAYSGETPLHSIYASLGVRLASNADGQASQATIDATISQNSLYNGTSWDRARAAAGWQAGREASVSNGTSSIALATAQAATGAGAAVDLVTARSNASITTTIAGGPSAVSVNLEGSNSAAGPWAVLATSTAVGGDTQFSTGKSVRYIRSNVTALTGGTAPTVTVAATAC